MPRIRIFVSYDGENDTDLHDQLSAQSARTGAPFEFAACSRGGTMSDSWTARTSASIRSADEVVVICGEHSSASAHMAAELRIAQEQDVPYMLVWGRRELMCTKPVGAKATDSMYSWTREIIEDQMSAVLRSKEPIHVPAALKRQQS